MTEADLARIGSAVAEAERRTRAEIVVVVNRRSGSYLDREAVFASLFALFVLWALVFSVWEFDQDLLILWVVLAWLVGIGLAKWRPVRARLLGARRRDRQVLLHARNAFHAAHVGGTRERTGLLVYASLEEDRVVLLPDYGIEGKVEPAAWTGILDRVGPLSASANPPEALCRIVAECGTVLAERLPRAEGDVDELPNRPMTGVA
ncbi:MAG: hypothetical protein AAB434_02500 [Planctomycetota bacterium]